jgi:histidine triad (HIT) family protein
MVDKKTTVFYKIMIDEIPSKRVYEDKYVFAFEDIKLLRPYMFSSFRSTKTIWLVWAQYGNLTKAKHNNVDILDRLLMTISKIAKELKLGNGYRIIINDGDHAV